jgi:hypothetical protein
MGSLFFGLAGLFIGAVVGNTLMAMISYRLFTKQFKELKPIIVEPLA